MPYQNLFMDYEKLKSFQLRKMKIFNCYLKVLTKLKFIFFYFTLGSPVFFFYPRNCHEIGIALSFAQDNDTKEKLPCQLNTAYEICFVQLARN